MCPLSAVVQALTCVDRPEQKNMLTQHKTQLVPNKKLKRRLKMLKKVKMITIAVVALMTVSAAAVAPLSTWPDGAIPPIVAQNEIPVVMLIDKVVNLTIYDPCSIELLEKPGNWWEGHVQLNIVNNFPVTISATIEPFIPDIGEGRADAWRCALEGDLMGLDDDRSEIKLGPFPAPGYDFRLFAAVDNPNLILRATQPHPQRVATVYLTVTD